MLKICVLHMICRYIWFNFHSYNFYLVMTKKGKWFWRLRYWASFNKHRFKVLLIKVLIKKWKRWKSYQTILFSRLWKMIRTVVSDRPHYIWMPSSGNHHSRDRNHDSVIISSTFLKTEKRQIIVYTYYIFPCFAIWSNFQSSSTIHRTNIRATQYPNSQIYVTARSLQNPKNLNNCTQEIVVEPLNAQRNILTQI